MTYLGAILVVLSVLCVGCAILYQKSDHVENYGSTMGGEMTSGAIWFLVATLAGLGNGILFKWYWGIATFLGIYVLSFKVRGLVESMLLRIRKETDNTEQPGGHGR